MRSSVYLEVLKIKALNGRKELIKSLYKYNLSVHLAAIFSYISLYKQRQQLLLVAHTHTYMHSHPSTHTAYAQCQVHSRRDKTQNLGSSLLLLGVAPSEIAKFCLQLIDILAACGLTNQFML